MATAAAVGREFVIPSRHISFFSSRNRRIGSTYIFSVRKNSIRVEVFIFFFTVDASPFGARDWPLQSPPVLIIICRAADIMGEAFFLCIVSYGYTASVKKTTSGRKKIPSAKWRPRWKMG